jgi:hypothetical protein
MFSLKDTKKGTTSIINTPLPSELYWKKVRDQEIEDSKAPDMS